MILGVLSDGKYGERAFQYISAKFETKWIEYPEMPQNSFLDDDFELNLPECDLYISYLRHPDLLLFLAEETEKPIILGISLGLGLTSQMRDCNPNVISPRTMCSLEANTGIEKIDEYAEFFGKPNYNVEVSSNNIINNIGVIRTAPCGSSLEGANFLKGKILNVKNLQEFALSVCHECRAPRFGSTCDKEISGIIHILSVLDAYKSQNKSNLDNSIQKFYDDLKNEYETRKNK